MELSNYQHSFGVCHTIRVLMVGILIKRGFHVLWNAFLLDAVTDFSCSWREIWQFYSSIYVNCLESEIICLSKSFLDTQCYDATESQNFLKTCKGVILSRDPSPLLFCGRLPPKEKLPSTSVANNDANAYNAAAGRACQSRVGRRSERRHGKF